MRFYPRIALTGGIASGKSTVASMLREKGAIIIDADIIAREVVKPGTACWQALKLALPADFFDETGQLNRKALRKAMTKSNEIKKTIEEIIHPAIVAEMKTRWEDSIAGNPDRIVIFDIPLLFELDLQHRFDFIIVVYAPRDVQLKRLAVRDGISPEEAERLINLQQDIESKRTRASALIMNDKDIDETSRQVDLLWLRLVELWHNFSKSPGAPQS